MVDPTVVVGRSSPSMQLHTIRWFQPNDVDDFLDLYADVFDAWHVDREWFAWKYVDTPYVDRVPILVAERDGELVGARPFFALPMAVGGRRLTALQPADTMVRSDHRGQGIFSGMTRRAIDHYGPREPGFFFNFPNEQSLPGYRKLGWETVGEEARFYRVEDSERVLAARDDARRARVAGKLCGPLVSAYNRLREETASIPRRVPVRTHTNPPVDELASIYRRSVPDAIHAVRDETFLDWRLENPHWEYTTYVTDGPEEPVATIVGDSVGLATGVSVTRIADVLPVAGDRRDEQLLALLERVLRVRSDSDVFVAPAAVFPSGVMRRLGFFRDDWPPLRFVARGRTLAVRSLGEWSVNGIDLRRADRWRLSSLEVDTS